ncbi:MAG: ABC transporter permease [Ilumatobacteraceae bacterium]
MSWRDRPTALVAQREIREATRATSFRVTLLISAIALAAIIVIANLGGNDDDSERIVVSGPDAGQQVDGLQRIGAAVGIDVTVSTAGDDATAVATVDADDADVAITADGSRITTREELDLTDGSTRSTLVNVLRAELALQNGLRDTGLDADQVAAVRDAPPPTVDALETSEPDDVDSSRVATATITNILLFILLQTYGQWVVTAVTREKASRVVEVLLAVIRPRQLLVGKVIGIGTVALLHAAVLIAVALVTTRVMGVDIASGISVGDLLLSAAWFVLGYALYCNAYAAAGSLVSRVEDAQTVAFPIMLPLLFGYLVSFTVVGGASTLLWVLAFFPPTAVVAMPTLFAVGEAPVWAVVVSMAMTVAAIVAVAALAARIYERSVLRTGKKLSWREAFRSPREVGPGPVGSGLVTSD